MNKKLTFEECQEIIRNEELYVFYDNDYWELTRHSTDDDIELTKEEDKIEIVLRDKNIDFETFPKNQVYGVGNWYGCGLMVLLANTPNHKLKGVRVA